MYEIQMALRYAPEIWADVPNYEGLYQVSNLGRVKSLDRTVKSKKGFKTYKGKILKPRRTTGYEKVLLQTNSKKDLSVHRLVAMAFIANPSNKPQVNHINGYKFDNCICNLEWATRSENVRHADENKLRRTSRGSKHHRTNLTEAQAKQVKELAA